MSQQLTQKNPPPWFAEALAFSHLLFVWGMEPKTHRDFVMLAFWARIAVVITGVILATLETVGSYNGLLLWGMVALWCFGGYYVYYAIHLLNTAKKHFGGVRNAVMAARIAACWHHTSSYPGGHKKLFSHAEWINREYRGEQTSTQ